MQICSVLLLSLMICFAASRPQYNYKAGNGLTSALPNLSFNTGSVSSLPTSYNPGLVQDLTKKLHPEPTSINTFTGQLQIIPSKPLSQGYLPPAQQNFPPIDQYLPPLQSYLPPSQSYIPPSKSYIPPSQTSPSQSYIPPTSSVGQQSFNDVSQLPLQQQQNPFSAIPVAPAFSGVSQGLASNLNQQPVVPQQRTIVTKDIYVHTAPQDNDENVDFRRQLASVPIRRNYRIIFIKAPTQNIRVAAEALRQAQAVNEERTVIYVLSKKADVADLQKQLVQVQGSQTVSRKPEVYFIKYKTNEEAQRAQQEIQAQYDALGGSTNISDEGFAPVSSVIGALGNNNNLSADSSSKSGSVSTPSRTYLPPAKV